jgi:hypothetical protein
MADIKSNRCWFCPFNNLSWLEKCENCTGITLPTRNQDSTELKWKVYSFGSIRAPDSERKDPTSFRGCLKYLKGHSATAIRVGDGFLLAHYPESGKRYSIRHRNGPNGDTPTYLLNEGGDQALLFHIVEQILGSDMIGSRW